MRRLSCQLSSRVDCVTDCTVFTVDVLVLNKVLKTVCRTTDTSRHLSSTFEVKNYIFWQFWHFDTLYLINLMVWLCFSNFVLKFWVHIFWPHSYVRSIENFDQMPRLNIEWKAWYILLRIRFRRRRHVRTLKAHEMFSEGKIWFMADLLIFQRDSRVKSFLQLKGCALIERTKLALMDSWTNSFQIFDHFLFFHVLWNVCLFSTFLTFERHAVLNVTFWYQQSKRTNSTL